MFYHLYEINRALLRPVAELAHAGARAFSSPKGWYAGLPGAPLLAAWLELMYRLGKDYPKPEFGIEEVQVGNARVRVIEEVVLRRPFCRLLHFERRGGEQGVQDVLERSPTVLVVAPLSGHHATLLRDTVRTMLSDHDVYITDWIDARLVPLDQGPFTLEDYVGYVRDFIRFIGAQRLHVMSVCQPCVPVLAAVSLMAAAGEPVPRSLTMMGGPIDARNNPTQVNELARTKSLEWFERNLLQRVPPNYPGYGRRVYPGFLQYAGFVAMNPGHHMKSHWDFFGHLVRGDLEDADTHRRFYDEYNAVLDMPGEYYLDSVRIVFQEYLLPRKLWRIGGNLVDPAALTDTALLTVEGELDDISGRDQTRAAHELCANIPAERKQELLVQGTGHYGIFSGRRWRERVYPVVRDFIRRAAGAPAGRAA
ncbi:MAG TPA: polyhydroxyalkanoate depolymerase [Polyangiaceae bacterium]|nr:polyhydroxyalkanoate depolymerase [Polyangiaceae bacterium]